MCEVKNEPSTSAWSAAHEASISSVQESEKRGITAYRLRPTPCQRSASARPSSYPCCGEVSRSGRRIRSLTTSPLVIRSPRWAACVNRTSIAGAKWAPKTRAVVVPAAASPSRKSPATAARVVGVGQQRLLGQRAAARASPAAASRGRRSCGPGGSARACRRTRAAPGRRSGRRQPRPDGRGGPRRSSPRSRITPSRTSTAPSTSARRRAARERIVGGVQERASEERHRCVAGGRIALRRRQPSTPGSRAARSNSRSRDAATLTAIVAGSLPARSAIPIGVATRAIVCSS